jgi:predicted MFS family arabinose efflux permease
MLLWSGQAVSALGTRTAQIAYPLLVLALTGSPARAGVVGFASGLPYLLFSLPAGALVDRWDRKRVLLACDAGRALAVGSLAVALAAGELTFAHIVVVAFVEGTFTVFVGPAEFGALRHVVPTQQIPTAISQNEARVYAASLSGPPLGGFLFGLGRGLPFVADAVSYVISFGTLLAIKSRFQDARLPSTTRLHIEIVEGVRWLWRQSFLRAATALAGAGNFVSNALALVIIVLAQREGASAATVGVIFALSAAGGLLGSAVAPALQRRVPAARAIVGYLWVYALLIPLLAVVPPLGLGVLFGLMLLGAPMLNAIFGAYQVALVPDRLMGRVDSAGGLVAAGAAPLGRLSAGVLLEAIGAVPTVFVFAGISAVTAFAALATRSIRHAPEIPVTAAEGASST